MASESLEHAREFGPANVRWPAWVAGAILVGVLFAPVGALVCAVLAFLADHPIQKRWRGGFIILAAVFIALSFAGVYLINVGRDGEEEAPPGGEGVQGQVLSIAA